MNIMNSPEKLSIEELKNSDAIASVIETAAQNNGTSPRRPLLDVAVALLEKDGI